MKKPSLSAETILAALAVLGTTAACSKDENPASKIVAPDEKDSAAPTAPAAPVASAANDAHGRAEPAPAASAEAPAASASTVAPPAATTTSAPKTVTAPATATVTATPMNAPGSGDKGGGQASCAAGKCSPDMKKGH